MALKIFFKAAAGNVQNFKILKLLSKKKFNGTPLIMNQIDILDLLKKMLIQFLK